MFWLILCLDICVLDIISISEKVSQLPRLDFTVYFVSVTLSHFVCIFGAYFNSFLFLQPA